MTSQVWDGSPARSEAGEPRWLDAEEQKAWRAWLYSSLLLQDRLDRDLTHETGISHAYYEILVALSETPDRMMRMSELLPAPLGPIRATRERWPICASAPSKRIFEPYCLLMP